MKPLHIWISVAVLSMALAGCRGAAVRVEVPEIQSSPNRLQPVTPSHQFEKQPTWIMYVGGAVIAACGAVAAVMLKTLYPAIVGLFVGVGLSGSQQFLSRYQWAFWIPFGLCVAALVYALWESVQRSRTQSALDTIVGAVEIDGKKVKALLKQTPEKAKRELDSVVDSAKKRLGITEKRRVAGTHRVTG